ncbi:MAG TPA: APC family permease [Acetobacteraceae bacterium]|nr:APC family permease [Acetobacteraceae bacterium]
MNRAFDPGRGERPAYRLSKVLGVLAIVASGVAGEFGAGINFVAVQSLGVYPAVRDLVPLAMLVTGLVVASKTLLYARFSAAMPRAGSAYVWIARGLNLPAGFIASFLWWISVTAAMGFIAFAFSTFLGQAFIAIGLPGHVLMTPAGRLVIGLGAIWGIFAIHASGVRHYGRFVTVLLGVIVLTAAVIAGFGFATPPGRFVSLVGSRLHLVLAPPAHPQSGTLGAFLSVCTLFVFAYGGISAAPALGGEARDAGHTMPRGIVLGWLVAVVLYTVVTAALFHAAPWWAVLGLIRSHHAALATAPGLIGIVAPRWIGVIVDFAVALIVGKTLAPQMMITSRILFAWGEDRMVPARFAETSGRRVPVAALATTAGLASLFLVQSVFVGWALGVIVRSLSLLIVWLLVALAALNIRFSGRFRGTAWTAGLARSPWVLAAAVVSVPITLVLIAAVSVLPHTPLAFQPLFQSAVAAIIAAGLVLWARTRAATRGESLADIALRVPVE